MMRNILLAVFLIPAFAWAQEGGHTHHDETEMETVSPGEPPIKITINPEARVSVARTGALPPPTPCGRAAELSVKIVNQAFVTGQLEANLVGDVPAGVTLDFRPERLKGTPEETRKLYITLTNPGPIDLTIAFKLRNELPDLGGRDRIYFLMRCLQAQDVQGINR